jgi:hypothetical protein
VLDVTAGPSLRLVSSYPENGAGFDCDPSDPSCGVPLDVSLEFRFDRFLLPTTVVRQSLSFRSGTASVIPRLGEEVAPAYDVFERVARYTLPEGELLEPHSAYTVELFVPKSDDGGGFRAFDGAPLAGEEPLRISFFTGVSASSAPSESAELGCEDAFCIAFGAAEPGCALPLERGCAEGGCHRDGGDAPMALVLDTPEAFERTARLRVAHGAETGPTTGVTSAASNRFGVTMPLVDPGRPDNSYLLYKLLLSPGAYEPSDDSEDACTGTRYQAAVDPELCFAPPAAELERLSHWFVQGEPMPPGFPSFVRRREIRALQDFIDRGASCP